MWNRFLVTATVGLAVASSIIGCGPGEPRFDPATRYSPGSLAQELAFRYKSLDPAAAGPKTDGSAPKTGAVTKGGAQAKAAQATTLDGLLDDVIAKAAKIPALSHAQACEKVAEEVAKDPTFTDADKKVIADKLASVTD